MLANYDLDSVQAFADSLERDRAQCNAEGMLCSDLDQAIRCQYEIALQLNGAISDWVRKVLAGEIQYEQAVETILLTEIDQIQSSAEPLLAEGQEMETECYSLAHFQALQQLAKRLSYLKQNWVSPRKSISPALRVHLNPNTIQEINENAAAISRKQRPIAPSR